MNPRTILLTGANRGIGLQLAKDLLGLQPKKLIVTCRKGSDSAALENIARENPNVKILHLDLLNDCEEEKVKSFASAVENELGEDGLNLFINNAGVLKRGEDLATLQDVFMTNAFAPLIYTKALIPQLQKAAQQSADKNALSCSRAAVVNVTSKVGSIEDNMGGGIYAYRGSKAALNMFTKNLSIEHGSAGILFLLLHPGWVKTEMGGPNAAISVEESSQGMLQVMAKSSSEDQCKFCDYKGIPIPW